MLRQASNRFFAAGARAFTSTALRAEATSKHTSAAFLEQWEKTAPSTLDPPKFAAEHLSETTSDAPTPGVIPEKLTFNFYMPHQTICDAEKVDMVLVPATAGDFGVLPGHVPTVAQLKPGVLSVHKDDKDIVKYFVSSGFAFVHADSSAEVCAVEAVELDHLDPQAVKEQLADYNNKLINAKDDYEKAAAQIGVEVTSAMNAALGQ
mmetsp:Transcript_38810/g.84472  ORF Transcript_38810/g.84472 Transcript_38810/m.84472 type:complete len:206 (-) Transcript_38810:122-739(-)|eukprot:CAMPEP_0118933874 /NCGR_PEP_ID=MMETSP1169-20130426/12795_1 /TAXON_ID=36882 /ORGANISM="Pyramimonas obovata, Strain CCMP722" /LENGTH=205 /DNA_ID=CAMNT_0006876697 /DNA_START=54 /DNA_END=671 /DNA_ORIENTATION=-